jgi:hypothetical protein
MEATRYGIWKECRITDVLLNTLVMEDGLGPLENLIK